MGKNKLGKFADLREWSNVYEFAQAEYASQDHPLRGHWASEVFGNSHPIVLELGCGKGEYAVGLAERYPDRNFIGIDSNPIVPELVRKRTDGCSCVFEYPENDGSPLCDCEFVPGLAYNRVFLNSFLPEEGLIPVSAEKLDFADSWAVGTVEDGVFTVLSEEKRTFRTPALKGELEVPLEVSEPVIRVSDVLGRRFFYALGQ